MQQRTETDIKMDNEVIDVRIENNVIDLTLDEDLVTDDFVADLINQQFDLFTDQNDTTMLYEDSDDDYFLDTKYMIFEGLEKEIGGQAQSSQSNKYNDDINEDDQVTYGPTFLAIEDRPTCSKFEKPNDTLNNKLSSNESFSVDTSYPCELRNNNNNDIKIINSLLSEKCKDDDTDATNRLLKLKGIISDEHKHLINIINNYLDTNRMFLEQKIRNIKKKFQFYIRRLIDDNYHIAYTETEFIGIVEKKLVEDIQKMKKQIDKKLKLEKSNAREIFFKNVTTQESYLPKKFNFVNFSFTMATLLENKIEIVNNFIRYNMEQVALALHKEVQNFIQNKVVLPKTNGKWLPIGNFILNKNGDAINYHEKIAINNNFNDEKELLRNFEKLKTKTADFKFQSFGKHKNKDMLRIYDEVAINDDESDVEQEADLNFLKSQIKILKDHYKNMDSNLNMNSQDHNKESVLEFKNEASMNNHKNSYKHVNKSDRSNQITATTVESRKMLKAKRNRNLKASNVKIAKDKTSPRKTEELLNTGKHLLNDFANTISKIEQKINKEIDVNEELLSLTNKNNEPLSGNKPFALTTEENFALHVNDSALQPGGPKITEAEGYQVKLHEHELLLLNEIKDDTTRENILKAVEKKMQELDQILLKTYQDIAIMHYERQKLGKYKEDLGKN